MSSASGIWRRCCRKAVFETDPDFNLTFANRRAFDLFGYTKEDFRRGLNGIHMLAPEERKRAMENFGKQMGFEDFEAFEYKGVRKDGSTVSDSVPAEFNHGK